MALAQQLTPREVQELSEEQFTTEALSERLIVPLAVDFDNPTRSEGQETVLPGESYGTRGPVPGSIIEISFKFAGSAWLFHSFASSQSSMLPCGEVREGELILTYTAPLHLAEERARQLLLDCLARDKDAIGVYIRSVNARVGEINAALPVAAKQAFRARKANLLQGQRIAASLDIPLKRRSPEDTRIVHVQPRRVALTHRLTSNSTSVPEWRLQEDEFAYILSVIDHMIAFMERSPQTFARMKEGELRDILLVALNGHYEGGGTGETFNFHGKTDILIRHEGKNVFIAECKFWNGAASFVQALDQLLGYTCWKDTRAALIVFNRQKNLTRVLTQIPELISTHPTFRRSLEAVSGTHLRFLLGHPTDRERIINLAILAFDVPDDLKIT